MKPPCSPLQGEGEPELFLVPLSLARRRGARVVSCSPLLYKERG